MLGMPTTKFGPLKQETSSEELKVRSGCLSTSAASDRMLVLYLDTYSPEPWEVIGEFIEMGQR